MRAMMSHECSWRPAELPSLPPRALAREVWPDHQANNETRPLVAARPAPRRTPGMADVHGAMVHLARVIGMDEADHHETR